MFLFRSTITCLVFMSSYSLPVIAQQQAKQGTWTFQDGLPVTFNFHYGTELSTEDIHLLAQQVSLKEVTMGFTSLDAEYVTTAGTLTPLRKLINLKAVHLSIDEINDRDIRFIAALPKLQRLEFNADNGMENICTEDCAKHLCQAKCLTRLVIQEGQFTNHFIKRISKKLPNLKDANARVRQPD